MDEPFLQIEITPAKLTRVGTEHTTAWRDGEFSFRDVLDTINPLQHIPVINVIYRWLTGDSNMGNIPRIVGDTLFGGPVGLLGGVVNVAIKEETGRDIGAHAFALLDGDAPPATAVAAAESPADAKPDPEQAPAALRADAATTPANDPPSPQVRMPGAAAATPPNATPSQRDFLAQSAAAQRRLLGNTAATPRPLSNTPVPLQIGSFPSASGRIHPAAFAGTTTTPASLPQNAPIEISQQMMDALDKYARMQQQRNALPAPGAALDLVQ
jgi:hypothetical protein